MPSEKKSVGLQTGKPCSSPWTGRSCTHSLWPSTEVRLVRRAVLLDADLLGQCQLTVTCSSPVWMLEETARCPPKLQCGHPEFLAYSLQFLPSFYLVKLFAKIFGLANQCNHLFGTVFNRVFSNVYYIQSRSAVWSLLPSWDSQFNGRSWVDSGALDIVF